MLTDRFLLLILSVTRSTGGRPDGPRGPGDRFRVHPGKSKTSSLTIPPCYIVHMSDSELSTAPPASVNSRKNPWSAFTGIKSIASSASSATGPNPAAHTRRINERRPIVPPRIVKTRVKRRRARSNATEDDLQATQARNIEQFESDNNEDLIDDIDGGIDDDLNDGIDGNIDYDNVVDSPSLHPDSQGISQTTSRSSSASRLTRKLQSDIWKYYTPVDNGSMKCNYCLKMYKIRGGTRAPRIHLLHKHKIDSANRQAVANAQYNERIEVALLRLPEEEKDRKDPQFLKDVASKLNKQHLEYLYMKWTILTDVEFSQICNKDFRTFLLLIKLNVCVDFDNFVFMIDCEFLRKLLSNYLIQKMIFVVLVRETNDKIVKSNEFVIIKLFFDDVVAR